MSEQINPLAEVQGRYEQMFGERPVFRYWHGADEDLQVLCQMALDRGSALTDAEIFKAQGGELPPEGSFY